MVQPTNQNINVIEMDARKFLRMLNSGAPSQIAIFSERIQAMGERIGRNWQLVSLDGTSVIIEDKNNHTYYIASIERLAQGRVKIANPKPIKITESEKPEMFHKNIIELVEAIEDEDTKKADNCFNRVAHQRFRSKVIPESGFITTLDGISRYIPVSKTIVNEKRKPEIIKKICEALIDTVKVTRGRIVEAIFNEKPIQFPVSELTRRRVVARCMKDVASKAYMSEGFQNRVKHIASLVCDSKIKEAVQNAIEFLKEEQEFSLLNLDETQNLVANTLAAIGSFNSKLAEDIGKVFFRTNCTINKDNIIKEWREVARMTEFAPFVENVHKLAESKNFEKDYPIFLDVIFNEDMTTKAAKAKMYLNALKDMRNILANSDVDQELTESIDEYIIRLERSADHIDDATLMEIEELVASTSENLLNDVNSLADYDSIPEPKETEPDTFGDQDLGDAAGAGGGGGAGEGGLTLPLGGEEPAVAEPQAGAEGEGAEGEGAEGAEGEGVKDEEEAEDILSAFESKKTSGKRITEMGTTTGDVAAAPGTDKCAKCGGMIQDEVCLECGNMAESVLEAYEQKLSGAVASLTEAQLGVELKEWQKNHKKFFEEDGEEKAASTLKIYILHADKLKSTGLAEGFKQILFENAKLDLSGVKTDPYAYVAPEDTKIGHGYNGLKEDHTEMPGKMKQSKEGGQVGGKETAKGDAMGCGGEADQNVAKDAGHKGALLKKGTKTAAEGITCPECKHSSELAECMTADGAACPHCGADVTALMMEALDIKENIKGVGHKMDRIDGDKGSVAKTSVTQSDGKGTGGKADRMDGQDGKGVAGKSVTQSDGQGAGGKKDGMDGQEGTAITGAGVGKSDGKSGKGGSADVDEDQYKHGTKRRRMAFPGAGRASLNKSEDTTIKKSVVEAIDDELGGFPPQDDDIVTDDDIPSNEPMDEPVGGPTEEPVGGTEEIVDEPLVEPDAPAPTTTVTVTGSEDSEDGRSKSQSVTWTTPDSVDDVVNSIAASLEPEIGALDIGDGVPGEGDLPGGEGEVPGGEGEMPGGDMMPPDEDEAELPGEGGMGGGEGGMGGEGEGGEGGPPPGITAPEEGEEEGEEGEEEEEKEVEEGKLPDFIKKKMDAKKGKGKDKGNKSDDSDEEEAVSEDNDLTAPTNKKYNSEDASRKDGDGKQINPKPKWSDKDYDGTKGAKTAKAGDK